TAPHAVTPATYRPPATAHETFSGLRARSLASTRTSSAWEGRLSEDPVPSAPGENPPTPAPTSSMTPARSLPCPDGNVDGKICATAPVRMAASLGLMPAALIRTRTCPSPGVGRSTSSTRSTSIPPNSSYLTALGMVSPQLAESGGANNLSRFTVGMVRRRRLIPVRYRQARTPGAGRRRLLGPALALRRLRVAWAHRSVGHDVAVGAPPLHVSAFELLLVQRR